VAVARRRAEPAAVRLDLTQAVALLPHGLLPSPVAMVRLLRMAPLARLVARPTLLEVAVVAVALTTQALATRAALVVSPLAAAVVVALPAALVERAELGLTAK